MLYVLAEELGRSITSLERLGVGFYPAKQAWVFPERNADGDIIGLTFRSIFDGRKWCAEGSKRGLFYEYNTDNAEGSKRYEAGRFHWVRIADAGVTCPICAKKDWCMVSSDNPNNPSAVLCSRISDGSVTELSGCGYIHILDKERQTQVHKGQVLSDTDLPIIIAEGASDICAAMDLGFVGIGRPSAEGGMEILKEKPLAGKEIWIIGENDSGAGKAGMEKTFLNVKNFSDSIYCVMPPEGIKDLRQWVNQGLTQEALFKYVGEYGCKGGTFDPNVLDDDVAFNIAKRFIDTEYTLDDFHILRNFKGQWVRWNEGKYDIYTKHNLKGDIYRYLEGKRYIKETLKGIEIAPYKPTGRKVADIIDAFSYISPINNDPPTWLDSDRKNRPRQVIAFKNGLLDVDAYLNGDIVLHEPTPNYFILSTVPYNFNPDAESQLFEDELNVVFNADDEMIRLVDQWLGYNLVPDNTFEKFMLYTGPPRSGKGTLIDSMVAMIGKNQCCATDFLRLISTFGCAPLFGKLSAIIGDEKTPRASEATTALGLMLRIIGNDMININQKYEASFDTHLFCRFTVAMNELPGFSDHSSALLARLNLLEFPNSFMGCEDFSIKSRCVQEAKEGKIINRALRGLKDLYTTGGFIKPKASEDAIERFIETTNPIVVFFKECCEVYEKDTGHIIGKDMLFDIWRGWCIDSGRKLYPKQTFCQRVKRTYPQLRESYARIGESRVRGWSNLSVNPWAKKRYLH